MLKNMSFYICSGTVCCAILLLFWFFGIWLLFAVKNWWSLYETHKESKRRGYSHRLRMHENGHWNRTEDDVTRKMITINLYARCTYAEIWWIWNDEIWMFWIAAYGLSAGPCWIWSSLKLIFKGKEASFKWQSKGKLQWERCCFKVVQKSCTERAACYMEKRQCC